MHLNAKLGLAALAGATVAFVAAQALHAQAVKPAPAYVIAEIARDPAKHPDPAEMKRYAAEAPPMILAHHGRYLVRGATAEAVEGAPVNGGIVVIGFDSLAEARGWYNSPEYAALRPFRQHATQSRILIVEGVAGT